MNQNFNNNLNNFNNMLNQQNFMIEQREQLNNNYLMNFQNNLNNIKISSNIGNNFINNEQKDKNNLEYLNKLNSIFPLPPRVGLDNIGTTGFINATLQCLFQIEEFALYFKYDEHINEAIDKFTKKHKDSLTASFKILVEKIWPDEAMINESTKRHFTPKEFRKKIADMNQIFKNSSGDPKDLINFIIMTLHEEQNQGLIGNNIIPNEKNKYDFNYIFQLFYLDYQRKFRSKISELFFSIQQIETECLSCCKVINYNFQIYHLLTFPIEEIRIHFINKILEENNSYYNKNMNIINNNFRMNNMNNFNNNINTIINNNLIRLNKLNNNIINIFDCFEYNQKKYLLDGNGQIYCTCCKMASNATYTTYLTTAPKILILIFYKENQLQNKTKLEFFEYLDLSNYIKIKTGKSINYRLIGVIKHYGESGEGNHFIAHCLSPIDNEWYIYNDSVVRKTDNFQKEIIDDENPYILFY